MTKIANVVLTVLDRLDFRRFSRRTKQWITASAGLAFGAGAVLSWRELSVSVSELRIWPIVLVILTAPLSLLLSGVEFRLLGRALDKKIEWSAAMDIALIGYAGNLLPIPGGALVRVSTLSGYEDVSPGRASQVTVGVGMIWLGLAFILAGLGLISIESVWAFLLMLAGLAVLACAALVLRHAQPRPSYSSFFFSVLALEFVAISVAAVRTYLAFQALGFDVQLPAALVVATSSAMSAAVSIAPAGLGIREGLSAGLADLAGIPAFLGFLAAVTLRLAGLLAAALVASLTVLGRRSDPMEDLSLIGD